MVQIFQPGALQDPGLGAASSLIGSSLGNSASLINNQKQNRNRLLTSLIGAGSTIGSQVLRGEQAEDLAEQQRPIKLLGALPQLQKIKQNALLQGDSAQANQVDAITASITKSALGIGDTGTAAQLLGPASSQSLQGAGQPELPTIPGGSQGLLGASGFQPIPDSGQSAPSIPVGDEFGINPSLGLGANLPLEKAKTDVTAGRQDIAKNRQQIIQGGAKTTEAQEFERISNLEPGSDIITNKGIAFEGVVASPLTNDILANAAVVEPKERTTRRVDNSKSLKTSSSFKAPSLLVNTLLTSVN